MKKFFQWLQENIGAIIAGALALFMYGSVIFPLNNIYSKAVHAASGWFHLLGWALTAGAVFVATKLEDRGGIIFMGILIALSLCSFAGFFA